MSVTLHSANNTTSFLNILFNIFITIYFTNNALSAALNPIFIINSFINSFNIVKNINTTVNCPAAVNGLQFTTAAIFNTAGNNLNLIIIKFNEFNSEDKTVVTV